MNSIITNSTSLFLQRQMTDNSNKLSVTYARLSSGMRINSAKDDAAGLQISNRLTSQVNGLSVAQRNANDGVSLAQTTEGALEEVTNILFRMRDLSLQAGNGILSPDDKSALNKESEQLKQELDRINKTTTFGGNKVFDQVERKGLGGANEAERNILNVLQSGVLAESENIIQSVLGLSGDGAKMKIDLENVDGAGGKLASVSFLGPGNGTELVMTIDLDDFSTLDSAKVKDLKSTLLHEMTHAVMANQMDLSSVPIWFSEGTAEAVSGADDRVASDIASYGLTNLRNETNSIFAAIPGSTPSTGIQIAGVYSGGYITMRYLEDQIGEAGIKNIMTSLSGGNSFDSALAAQGTFASNAALQSTLMAGTTFEDFVTANIDTSNADNGAFGGLDAAGGISREETIVGASSAKTTSNFDSYFVNGDDNTTNTDFGSGTNWDPTSFNEVALEDYNNSVTISGKTTSFQIGADANQTINMIVAGFSSDNLGLNGVDLKEDSQLATTTIDTALQFVDNQRSHLGASINRLEHTISNLNNIQANVTASRSRIQDTDYAIETATLVSQQIKQQAITSMLSQSKATPELMLQLLS
ncbi:MULTISPECIES: flagellinolysin [unclassified Colwellia]|uniref:flagellinolysin n=1 Tax=unclassified Colwellia TaxID=196834 RepID=UPI0015F3576D|nr:MULTISPECIES: flagellinolysin [unclassified Colwellia]MBA6233412.1 flagellinolysin [Colwellia sp. MB02u-7]MBA6236502.1 flagellinolysin [Colwellia sp. MB02u-11]MBA6257036.1 flagellinolysin [Colwellia sp. MB3u-28]MBA6260959.1 flagellinolysin [Colwellia sp. MB3u-41]MBA6298099.1 flagellinolysin [Colwellia sp. MB3u-22]